MLNSINLPQMKINPHITLLIFVLLLIFFTSISQQQTPLYLPNPRLQNAYIALQALKHSIISDPKNITSNWYGPNVCTYTGVYCAPAPDDRHVITVAGIDLNHGNLAGTLPEDLGLLTDLALFHINSNRFTKTLPESFRHLSILHELDVSNNLFTGDFPKVVLSLPSLKFLDIRFNGFSGEVPAKVFDLKLDALFINDNNFCSPLPDNFSNSSVSVIVLANNDLKGCFPKGIEKMAGTLNEIILINSGLTGCLPLSLGLLKAVTVFDVSTNGLTGGLPESIGGMRSLEELNVAHNRLSGEIPDSICSLPKLNNFTFSDNFFCSEPTTCLRLKGKDDRDNCIPERPKQRHVEECKAFYSHPMDCAACSPSPPPPPY